MTVLENVRLPLEEFTDLPDHAMDMIALSKLKLVSMEHAAQLLPSEISGGMRKRAALARAIALDPKYLFFDEPSAGLDAISAKNLDELIVEIRDSLGATVIIVTHELASIFAIATNSVFLSIDPIPPIPDPIAQPTRSLFASVISKPLSRKA